MKLQEIVVVSHSHTDLGFTHDQPVVEELHRRYLEQALAWCEEDAEGPSGEAFCWTVEVCGTMAAWLRGAGKAELERLRFWEEKGRIEIAALPWHFTPLADEQDLRAAFTWVTRLREEYGLRITSAMSSDVNGQNWPLVEVMLDHGIDGYSAAINTHFGRAPLNRPNLFLWQGPSGRTIRAFNGFPYGFPGKLGMTETALETFAEKWLPRLEQRLAGVGYGLPVLLMQSVHPFGDNAGPHRGVVDFARAWNATGRTPRITLGTPRTWWRKVAALAPDLPIIQGDWTDFWNFGSLSAARELTAHRRVRVALRQTDAVAAMLAERGIEKPRSVEEFRNPAWDDYLRWMEHTWTADCGAEAPLAEDVAAQSAQKAALVYRARSLAKMMRRDALQALALEEGAAVDAADLLLVNPLPWPRVIAGLVAPGVAHPRGEAGDTLAGAHFQDRKDDLDPLDLEGVPEMPWKQYPEHALPPTEVPAMGFRRLSRKVLRRQAEVVELPSGEALENAFFRVGMDSANGGIQSLVERDGGREWVAADSPWRLHQMVRETLAPGERGDTRWPRDRIFRMDWMADAVEIPSGWNRAWPAVRVAAGPVVEQRALRSELGLHCVQWLRLGDFERGLRQEIFLPHHAAWIECRSRWLMPPDPQPMAHYLVFPFSLPNATPRIDLGGAVMRPGQDQIPGCCHDYFTAQNWVDFSDDDSGVTIALPENPLVQLGDFSFGKAAETFTAGSATLLGWVTANYWHCNFPASQPGWVRSRYRLTFHRGFDATAAHRFAGEAAEDRPVLHGFRSPAKPDHSVE